MHSFSIIFLSCLSQHWWSLAFGLRWTGWFINSLSRIGRHFRFCLFWASCDADAPILVCIQWKSKWYIGQSAVEDSPICSPSCDSGDKYYHCQQSTRPSHRYQCQQKHSCCPIWSYLLSDRVHSNGRHSLCVGIVGLGKSFIHCNAPLASAILSTGSPRIIGNLQERRRSTQPSRRRHCQNSVSVLYAVEYWNSNLFVACCTSRYNNVIS